MPRSITIDTKLPLDIHRRFDRDRGMAQTVPLCLGTLAATKLEADQGTRPSILLAKYRSIVLVTRRVVCDLETATRDKRLDFDPFVLKRFAGLRAFRISAGCDGGR